MLVNTTLVCSCLATRGHIGADDADIAKLVLDAAADLDHCQIPSMAIGYLLARQLGITAPAVPCCMLRALRLRALR